MWRNDSRIVVVAAHPDDETIGLGGQLGFIENVTLIHITDGAPRRRADWKEYAQTRRAELLCAAKIAGIAVDRCIQVGLPDQEAFRHLVELSCHLSRLFDELKPQVIFTHAYEGGHPDHDATAFAVHHAATAPIVEFSSYHRGVNGTIETGCFLAADRHPNESVRKQRGPQPYGWRLYSGRHEINGMRAATRGLPRVQALPVRAEIDAELLIDLTSKQKHVKRRMLDCFITQRETLQWFSIDQERFRRAPDYDFTQPPHAGRVFYESFDWGCNAAEWLRHARRAEERIGTCLSR